jgi:hypothetical protein
MNRSRLAAMTLLLLLTGLPACSHVEVPAFHQVAVFADTHTTPAGSMETPVDLAAKRVDDSRWIVQSPVVQTASTPGFNEALVSWNIALAPGASAAIELSVTDGTEWSPRLRIGHVGDGGRLDPPRRAIDESEPVLGRVDIDYFTSDRPWRAAQVTVTIVGEHADAAPGRVDRLAVCLSNTLSRVSVRADRLADTGGGFAVVNDVPFRSQKTDDPSLAGRLCSPTSLCMVLAYRGVERSVGEVAARVRDPDFDLYGNWPRNIQGAYELGVPGFLARFNEWQSVAEHLMAGDPLIVSVQAPGGVLSNAPYRELDSGHLIVLRGLDGHGGVLVNDPAAATPEQGQRLYAMTELCKAWLELGNGTAYVLLRPQPGTVGGR